MLAANTTTRRRSLIADEGGGSFVEHLVLVACVALAAAGGWQIFGDALEAEAGDVGDEVLRICSVGQPAIAGSGVGALALAGGDVGGTGSAAVAGGGGVGITDVASFEVRDDVTSSSSDALGAGAGGSPTEGWIDDMGEDIGSMAGLAGTAPSDGSGLRDLRDDMRAFADARGSSFGAQVVAGLTDVATLPVDGAVSAVESTNDLGEWWAASDSRLADMVNVAANAAGAIVDALSHPNETAIAIADAASDAWDHCTGGVRGGTACVTGAVGAGIGAVKAVRAYRAFDRDQDSDWDLGIDFSEARAVGAAFSERYFTGDELEQSHPTPDYDIYHNVQHTQDVVGMEVLISRALGLSPEQVEFNGQVAILHDLDSTRAPGMPARASVTIADMEADFNGERPLIDGYEGSVLQDRFGWDERELLMGQAMIQRTEFPFDAPHPAYPGSTPRESYEAMLAGMSPEDQAYVIQEGAILSEYADKGGAKMIDTFDETGAATDGLANEIRNVNPDGFIPSRAGNDGFIGTIGRVDRTPDGAIDPDGVDAFASDREMAASLGVDVDLPDRNELFETLPPEYGRGFDANLEAARAYREALEGGADPATADGVGRQTAESVLARD